MRVGGRIRVRKLGWGLVDQAGSSLTNLLLTIAAGRILGPGSLGVVVIGFTAYLFLLGLQRAAVSEPLVVSTSASTAAPERDEASRNAVAVAVVGGVLLACVMAAAGVAEGGTVGRALLLFAPWIPSVLIQDLWRAILFRDSRGASAALNDWLWLVAMVLGLLVARHTGNEWAVVAAWGFGGTLGAALGFKQTRLRPLLSSRSWRYLRHELWPFGRWLFAGSVVAGAGSQGSVILIAELLGAAALGGLRAVQSVFAPLSLLSAAVALPALPAMSRRLSVGANEAGRFAVGLSGVLAMLTAAYVIPVSLAGSDVLGHVFGGSFQTYRGLIFPIVLQQMVTAGGGGFMLLLLAKRGGRPIFAVNVVTVPVTLASIAVGDAVGGLVGVAWSLGVVALLFATATAILALRIAPRAGGV